MSTYSVRLMIVRDLDTKEEVYGQMIHDEYLTDEFDPIGSTDQVVRAYMAEFCSGCYIRNNKLEQGTLSDTFEGVVAIVAEQAGMKEYAVVVKLLYRPVDNRGVIEYHNKSFKEWNAALELYRGNPDPRVIDEPDLKDTQSEISWNVFKQTFALVSLVMLIMILAGSFTNKDRT